MSPRVSPTGVDPQKSSASGCWSQLAKIDDCVPGGTKPDKSLACFCRFACLDMIEDRVRNRFVSVALICLLFVPLLGSMIIGNINNAASVQPAFVNFSAIIDPKALASNLAPVCQAEIECMNMPPEAKAAAAFASGVDEIVCPTTCYDLIHDPDGSRIPPPPSLPPGAPPMPPSAPDTTMNQEEITTFIIVAYCLVYLAMIGAPALIHAFRCYVISCAALSALALLWCIRADLFLCAVCVFAQATRAFILNGSYSCHSRRRLLCSIG